MLASALTFFSRCRYKINRKDQSPSYKTLTGVLEKTSSSTVREDIYENYHDPLYLQRERGSGTFSRSRMEIDRGVVHAHAKSAQFVDITLASHDRLPGRPADA